MERLSRDEDRERDHVRPRPWTTLPELDGPVERSGDASLDPQDWSRLRALAHRMLNDVFDELAGLWGGPVWRPMPARVRRGWEEKLPRSGDEPETVYAGYRRLIAPYGVGNRHPRFFGGARWRHRDWCSGGTAGGGTECQLRWAGSRADRLRASGGPLGGRDAGTAGRLERARRDRHVDGEFRRGTGGAYRGVGG